MIGTPDAVATSSSSKNGSPIEDPHAAAAEEPHDDTAEIICEGPSTDAITPTIEKEVVNVVEDGGGGGGPPIQKQKQHDIATPMTPLPQVDSYTYGTYTTPRSGYYGVYNMTPEPASPATHPAVYDVTSFLQQHQQQQGGLYPSNSPFLTSNAATLSPSRSGIAHGVIPPPSPLFPRVNSAESAQGPPPVLPYMSPQHQANGYNPAAEQQEGWNAMPSNERYVSSS